MPHRGYIQAVLLALLLVVPAAAPAQTEVLGQTVDGHVELGWRFFIERPSVEERTYFERFRDIPPGPFLEDLRLRLWTFEDRDFIELQAREVGEEDQSFLLWGGSLGFFVGAFEWDQLPRVYSRTARILHERTAPGVFELDDAIQTELQGLATTPRRARLEELLAGARRIDVETRWDTARLGLVLTPTPEWDVAAEWTRIRKEGTRPFGVVFGSPGGNLVEILEPVEQTINDLRLQVGFARRLWQVQGAYHLSLFGNDLDALIVDNPLRATDHVTAGPVRGRVALAPSNVAHTVSLTGAVNLPLRTRVTSTVSYGMRFQNEPFLPHTINTAIVSPLLDLPASSLDGDVRTFLGNIQLTSRPLPAPVSLTARYRYYDFDNRTPVLEFPARVRTDQTLIAGTIHNEPYSYTKQNAGVDVGWRPFTPVSLKAGWGWEQWSRPREMREVGVTDEHTPRVALDVTPVDWLLLRTSYARAWRTADDYQQVAAAQLPLLRKYDMADRIRDRVDFLAEVTPFDALTLTGTFSLRQDDYHRSPYGLQDDESWAAGLDVNWFLTERVSVFAGYMREEFDARMRSRSRTGTVDLIDNDWVARNRDSVDTYSLGVDAALVPGRLDLRLAYNFMSAFARMQAATPLTPTLAAAAAVTDFPNIRQQLHVLETTLRYHFAPNWSAGLRYAFEHFRQSDFRTDVMQPYMGGDDIWLGARIPDYTAHIISALVRYRF
jgi:MtrB/PioB family decaheme-associated outer membrane protein